MGRRLITVASIAFVLFHVVGRAQQRTPRLVPVDEASGDSGLVMARSLVVDALRQHNLDRLMPMIGEDLRLDNAPQTRKADLIVQLRSEWDSFQAGALLSDELLRAITLGGAFRTGLYPAGERQFCAPYVYSAFPKEFEHLDDSRDDTPQVVIEDKVAMRKAADPQSPIVATLSYNVVYVGFHFPDKTGRLWTQIEGPGISGFVPKETVRDPADWHVCFGRRAQMWKIVNIGTDRFPYHAD